MKSTKTKRYVVEKKFRERYMKIQLRSSSQRSTHLPFESGTSRAIAAVAILLCLSSLVSLVLQYWSVCSSNRKGLQETKQELLFHSNQDQLSSNLCVGVCMGSISAPLSWTSFSRRQQYLFKIKIGTFKDIIVWSSQGLKRPKFPDVIRTDRQTDRKLTTLAHAR